MYTFPCISSNINNLNDSMFTDTVYFVFLSLKQWLVWLVNNGICNYYHCSDNCDIESKRMQYHAE